MRIAKVVGKLSLVKAHSSIAGKRWLLVVPYDLPALLGEREPKAEELVAIDELGATAGDLIGISEGMEATFPYFPTKIPIDAYNACILDEIDIDDNEVAALKR